MFIFFSSVLVAECPPFGKKLLTRLTILTLCILTVTLVISHLGFEGWISVLIASVPDLCIRFSLSGRTVIFWMAIPFNFTFVCIAGISSTRFNAARSRSANVTGYWRQTRNMAYLCKIIEKYPLFIPQADQ